MITNGWKYHATSAPPCLQLSYKRLNSDNTSAIEEVKQGRSSVKCASEQYVIPRMTLQDRLLGRVQHGVKPCLYLKDVKERDIY